MFYIEFIGDNLIGRMITRDGVSREMLLQNLSSIVKEHHPEQTDGVKIVKLVNINKYR